MSGNAHRLWAIGAPIVGLCAVALAAAGAGSPGPKVRLPRDLVFDREVGAEMGVVFRHWTHVEFTAGNCLACHPAPFKLLHPERTARHEELNAGRSCGACHDGKQAFGTADDAACESCHAGSHDPERLAAGQPGDLVIAGTDSPGRVTFSHAAHGGTGQRCAGCHPDLFARRAGGTQGDASLFHERCGSCHDGSTACAVDDACERCHSTTGDEP